MKNLFFVTFILFILMGKYLSADSNVFGELVFKYKSPYTGTFNLTVSTSNYSWDWDEENSSVFIVNSYSRNITNVTSYSFDSPKSNGSGNSGDAITWGLMTFTIHNITGGSNFTFTFSLDLRDENWATDNYNYPGSDTYVEIDPVNGKVYRSHANGGEPVLIADNEILTINQIWDTPHPPVRDNFTIPVTLANRIENQNFDFGFLYANNLPVSSGGQGKYFYLGNKSVGIGTIEYQYLNKRHYNFKWENNNINPITNTNVYDPEENFSIPYNQNPKSIIRNFKTVWPLTIKNNLIESNQSSFGNVWFKDPTTTNEFELKSASGDGYINNEAFNNLNEIINNQPNQRYAVKAVNSFSANGRNYYWFNGDFNPENGTDILVTGETTLTANFKGTQLSNDQDAFNTNSQRKFVRTGNGHLHSVYTSLGALWYERSTDNGQTWEIMNDGKPLDNGEGKLPAIDSL